MNASSPASIPTATSSAASDGPVPSLERHRWFLDEIHAHGPALKSYLAHSFPTARSEVDDLVQESFLRIWKTRTAVPVRCAKAFLFRVARNVTLDLLRRKCSSPVRPVGNLDAMSVLEDGRGVPESLVAAERIERLAAGLATLPPRGRTIIMLCKFHGLSAREVAAQLGISEKTVEEHIYRGMKRLGAVVRQHESEDGSR